MSDEQGMRYASPAPWRAPPRGRPPGERNHLAFLYHLGRCRFVTRSDIGPRVYRLPVRRAGLPYRGYKVRHIRGDRRSWRSAASSRKRRQPFGCEEFTGAARLWAALIAKRRGEGNTPANAFSTTVFLRRRVRRERATTRAQRFCFALVICRPLGPWSVSPSNRSYVSTRPTLGWPGLVAQVITMVSAVSRQVPGWLSA
jgi:hypothetical protein